MKTWDEGVAEHWLTEGQIYYRKSWTVMSVAFALAYRNPGDEQRYVDQVLLMANKFRAEKGLPPVDGKAER
jgi:hypothetical protein